MLKKAYMSESYALRPNRDQARKMRLLDGRSAGKLDRDHATLARDQYFANWALKTRNGLRSLVRSTLH